MSADLRIDRSRWSPASQRSVAAELSQTHYVDQHYTCLACACAALFSAQAQKVAFEQRKRYVGQVQQLCAACHRQRIRLARAERAHQRRWAVERDRLKSDRAFLRSWLDVLDALAAYPGRRSGMHALLRRLCDAADCSAAARDAQPAADS